MHKFYKVPFWVTLCSKYARALTFEKFCQGSHARLRRRTQAIVLKSPIESEISTFIIIIIVVVIIIVVIVVIVIIIIIVLKSPVYSEII